MIKLTPHSIPSKFADYSVQNEIPYTSLRLAQIYWLNHVEKLDRRTIASITEYQESTVRTKLYLIAKGNYEELANELFNTKKEKAKVKAKPIFQKNFRDGRASIPIDCLIEYQENTENHKLVYLFKFYDNNKILFSKIGTTERDILNRLKNEIYYYTTKNNFDIQKVEICAIRDCNGAPPEGAESALRAEIIRLHPSTYIKNDRFLDLDIDTTFFNNILNGYLK